MNENKYPRVIIYVNIRLSSFHFSIWKDIIDHRNIILISFFNKDECFQLMNVYSDSLHTTLKYFKDTEVNICNLLVITRDFNIQDNLQDPYFPHHSSISYNLIIIADSFNLNLSCPINQVPIRYSNNNNNSNSVIDLIFLRCSSSELNNHSIYPDWYLISDYTLLSVIISITKENIDLYKRTITKNSEKEESFIKEVIASFKNLDISNILDIPKLEQIVNDFANIIDNIWMKNSRIVNITRHSKSWQNKNCNKYLARYRSSKSIEDWKTFRKTVKNTKWSFFDLKIQEIANKKHSSQELISQINKCKLPAIKIIKYNGQPCLDLEDLWQALHSSFNTAQFCYIDESVLNKLGSYSSSSWTLFAEKEFTSTIVKCNNISVPSPNKLLQRHLKCIIKNKTCLKNIITIANVCFEIGYWPNHFKNSMTIIIPKPNKILYNSLKSFKPIVLLNTLGKLIKKFISNRL